MNMQFIAATSGKHTHCAQDERDWVHSKGHFGPKFPFMQAAKVDEHNQVATLCSRRLAPARWGQPSLYAHTGSWPISMAAGCARKRQMRR